MAQLDGIGAITAELEARVKSPEGKLDIAKSGVKVAHGQKMRSPWEKLLNFQKAVARLKEEAKNFKDATGMDVPAEITALIAEAEKDIQYLRKEMSERDWLWRNMIYNI
jgi:hypothetical protein